MQDNFLYTDFFAVVLHGHNVKLGQKLPSYTFYGGNAVCVPVLFFGCHSFSPWCSLARLEFRISHRRYKILMLFFQQNWSPLLFFTSRSSSSSVIHVNVDIKFKSKERIGVVVVTL